MAVPAGSAGERLPVLTSAANLMVEVDALVVSTVLIEIGRERGASLEAPSPSASQDLVSSLDDEAESQGQF
jgi:hypothetical protein